MTHAAAPFAQQALRTARCTGIVVNMAASLVVLAAGPTLAANDVPPIQPGLWEMVTESQQINGQPVPDHSAEMLKQMKSMPPAMRQQIEAQMKAQGIQMVPGQGGTAVRMCLTAEMLKSNRWQRNDGQCQTQVVSRSGNTWRWKSVCAQPPSQGEGTTTFVNSESYTGEMRSTADVGGKTQTMQMKHRARRVSGDCGGLKPMQPPGAR